MDIISLLASDNYIVVNKDLIKEFGINTAIMVGELASEHRYYAKNDKLDDGYFYSTIENIQENTGLSRHQQKKALDDLKEQGIVDIVIKGIPAKRFIKFDVEKLANKFVKNLHTGVLKSDKLDSEKVTRNSNNINSNKETIIINNNNKDIYIPFDEIISYLNNRAGTSYRSSSKKTRDLIKARYNEGFMLDDFKTVIDKKCIDWLSNNDMCKYLRPETLFGNKFEGYLGQKTRELTTKDLEPFINFDEFTETPSNEQLDTLF